MNCTKLCIFLIRRRSRIFSMEKILKLFSTFFFRSTKLIFGALPNHYKEPNLTKFSAPQETLKKNRPKKAFLCTFWKMLTKNCVFSARAPPSNLVYIGAKGAFRKILKPVIQKWISRNSTKGDPLGQQGVESLRDGGPPPSLNPLLILIINLKTILWLL